MNTLNLLSILIVTGGATAYALDLQGDQPVDQPVAEAHEHETPNCCAPSEETAPRANYLVHANPLGEDDVKGTATGKVVFGGKKRPEIKELTISEQQEKGCVEGGKTDRTDRSLLISKEGGIANAVITIDVDGAKLEVPEEPILLDQIQCRYEPHVMMLPMGATAKYHNSDTISHNVHTYSTKNPAFNKTIAAGASEMQKLEKSEAIEVKCDIHPWMSCYVFVSDTPYAAITKADGSFSIEGLPPGEYTAKIWHEKLGKEKAKVTIGADGSCEAVEVKLGSDEGKGGGRRRRR